jgi:methionyl-tRNA synthetase
MQDRFYVTTPIYYVNDEPHLGHLYTTVAADTLARYHRSAGRTVHFLTGTDEHGQKIEEAARARGIAPKALADEMVPRFRDAWAEMDVVPSDFIRTTDLRHARVVSAMWERMAEKGDVYKGTYEGQYCVGCEEFYTETQAPDGRCPTHQRALEPMKEESYFFRLSRYTEPLLAYYAAHPELIRPENRYNEIVSFVRGGLHDLSISRKKLRWGIPVPGDAEHVVYVWLDALVNYVSALGSFDPPSEAFRTFWPADVHIIGKDILRFHAVYWPAFLLSAGLPLPRQLFVHGWWTVEGQKMSKSLGNVVRPAQLREAYGVDPTRYFLLRDFPFGADGDFSRDAVAARYNAELANDLGNLLNRTLTMCSRYLGGTAPVPVVPGPLGDVAAAALAEHARAMRELAFSRACEAVLALVRAGNKYIDENAPWALHKAGETEKLAAVLGAVCEALRLAGLLLAPFMPRKMDELRAQLGVPEGCFRVAGARFGGWEGPFRVTDARPLFPRIEVPPREEAPKKPAKRSAAEPAPLELKPEVSFEDFGKLDLRVALVKSAERVPKSDKLLRLVVDIGEERQVVAGIGKRYAPEDLVGRRVIVVANLRPIKLMGVESRGMILAAGGETDLEVAGVPESVVPGTRVK